MKIIASTLVCFLLGTAHVSAQAPAVVTVADDPMSEKRAADVRRDTPVAEIIGQPPIAPVRPQPPLVAGRNKTIAVNLGYAYVSSAQSLSNRLGLRGADAGLTIDFSRLGVAADLGYARAANVFGTGRHSDVLSYMAGPVFYPTRHRNFNTYVRVLLGGAKVSGPVRVADGRILLGGWLLGYAWAPGGGIEYWFSDSLSIRAGADYMRTAYFDATLAVRSQYNIRTTATAVYFFGRRSRSPR